MELSVEVPQNTGTKSTMCCSFLTYAQRTLYDIIEMAACSSMFIAVLVTITRKWRHLRCQSPDKWNERPRKLSPARDNPLLPRLRNQHRGRGEEGTGSRRSGWPQETELLQYDRVSAYVSSQKLWRQTQTLHEIKPAPIPAGSTSSRGAIGDG